MKLIRKIGLLFVPVYYLATCLRNMLYDLGIKKSTSYNFPIICVGNLSVGGTGKTPMIEYLINLLKSDYLIATLSRGYKRKTKGFQLGSTASTVEILGDEPLQFYNKFGNDILVAVDTNRVNGIQVLRQLDKAPEVILLDDAFQHRKVRAGLNILLSAYGNIYTKDTVLPTGNLREPRSGAKRADIIIITKCPEHLSETEKQNIVKGLCPNENQKVFFSTITYSEYIFSSNDKKALDSINNFTLVTGIANANTLVDYLKGLGVNFEHLDFKDHHSFTGQEIDHLKEKQLIITTEKDFMRLKQYDQLKNKLFYLPITIAVDRAECLNKLVMDFVKNP